MAKTSLSRIGFMLCCFLLPGLIGTFATFSIPAPLIDEQHQQAALDAVLNAPNPKAQAAAIQNLAGAPASAPDEDMAADTSTPGAVDADTAAIVANSNLPLPARIAAAEANMHQEDIAHARAEAYRIRLMVITMTILGAAFGVALMGPAKS